MINLAIDIGYGTSKYAIRDASSNSLINGFIFSKVGTHNEVYMKEKISEAAWSFGRVSMKDAQDNTVRYFVHKLTRHSDRLLPIIYKDWIHHDPYAVLSYASIGIALKQAGYVKDNKCSESINLITGLPVEYYYRHQDKEFLISKFNGDHEFNLGDTEFKLNISLKPQSILPQPAGAYHDILLDDNATIVDEFLDAESIGVIDIGNNTTDLIMMQEDEYISQKSNSTEIGVNAFYEKIERSISAKYNVKESIEKINSCVRSPIEGRFFIKIKDPDSCVVGMEDITEIINTERVAVVSSIYHWINQHWGTRSDIDSVFVAGGGAKLFEEEIRNLIPEAVFIDEGTCSNVRGYLKWRELCDRETNLDTELDLAET